MCECEEIGEIVWGVEEMDATGAHDATQVVVEVVG